MELAVLNTSGGDTGRKVTLADSVFGIAPNDHAIYLDVKQYLANQRQGTHKSKERNEVAGSSKKLKRQKGTGGARAGNRKSPTIRGGGRAFGPEPRDYRFKLNKKQKELARKSALSYKASGESISVIEGFNFDKPQTKEFTKILQNLALTGKKTLIVLPEDNDNIYLSSRNVQKVSVTTAGRLNTYQIMYADVLVLSEGSVEKFS